MTIFDFLETQSVAESSQECPRVTENVPEIKTVEEPKPNICTLSQHTCNKSELWNVADTLDEVNCPHICCNQCNEKMCGARCNGSQEPQEKPVCKIAEECEAYPQGCGGTIDPCRFGGAFKWSDKSKEPEEDVHIDRDGKSHKVPEWMDYKRCENCNRWARYTRDEQPPEGWGEYGWCNEHKDKCISVSCCSDFEDKRGK